MTALVEMRDIRKSFGSTRILHGVDFDVLPGEVHVLAGENGAGKSTLIKILSGVYHEYSGQIRVGGHPYRFSRPSQAVEAGIATIHQELSLIPSMSVSDNLFLGQERTNRLGHVDFRHQEAEAVRILNDTVVDLFPKQLVEDLPIAGQQSLEIARALARDAQVVVFDEPTSALGEAEVEALFRRILDLRSQDRGIVYITHKMEEIYRLADRITVLRDGELVRTVSAEDLQPEELVRLMVGRDLATNAGAQRVDRGPAPDGVVDTNSSNEIILEVNNLCVAHPHIRNHSVVAGVDFSLRRGEVLGLAGLQGSGKSEVLHALFGAMQGRASGNAVLAGTPLPLSDPADSVENGLVLLTNDRKSLGIAPELSVTHSVSLSSLGRFSNGLGWISRNREWVEVDDLTQDFRLKTPSLDAPSGELSGGNQQKVYLARCLLAQPKVLLLDEPTRGIDVGAKADIYGLMSKWVQEGISMLLITSEMDELLTLSDRILVMYRGRVTKKFTRGTATKELILAAAMGHAGNSGNGEKPIRVVRGCGSEEQPETE